MTGLPSTWTDVPVPKLLVARSCSMYASATGAKVRFPTVAGVVTVTAVLWPDVLPAASLALTVYVYVVDGDTPVSEKEVVGDVPTEDPFRNTV